MQRPWAAIAISGILLGGCSQAEQLQGAPPPKAAESTPQTPPRARPKLLKTKPTKKAPPQRPAADVPVDQFNLPLVIHIEAPPVPPEIEGPSPPIEKTSETPAQ